MGKRQLKKQVLSSEARHRKKHKIRHVTECKREPDVERTKCVGLKGGKGGVYTIISNRPSRKPKNRKKWKEQ